MANKELEKCLLTEEERQRVWDIPKMGYINRLLKAQDTKTRETQQWEENQRGYEAGIKVRNTQINEARHNLLEEMREKWCYDTAHGHPVFSMRLEDWVQLLIKVGLGGKNWWELKQAKEAKDGK